MNTINHNGKTYTVGIDPGSPEGDRSVEVMKIDDTQRRKLFGYAKAAWEAEGSPGNFNEWRHEQQQACGVSSLKFAVKEQYFKLVQHFMEIIRTAEEAKAPKYKDGTPITANSHSRRVLIIDGCANQPQLRKINALLVDQSLSWEYADSIATNMFGVKQVQWCDGRQLRAVISALMKRQKRHGGRRGAQ